VDQYATAGTLGYAAAVGAHDPPTTGATSPAYCWTHGFSGHTSGECRSPRPGHRRDATADRQLGGRKGTPRGRATSGGGGGGAAAAPST
jgi:hypothetical protein